MLFKFGQNSVSNSLLSPGCHRSVFRVHTFFGRRETIDDYEGDLKFSYSGAILLEDEEDPSNADVFQFHLAEGAIARPAYPRSESHLKGSPAPAFTIRCVTAGDGEGKFITARDDGPGPLFFANGHDVSLGATFVFLPLANEHDFEMIYLDHRGIEERGYTMFCNFGDCLGQYDDCCGAPLQVAVWPVPPSELSLDPAQLEASALSSEDDLKARNALAVAKALVTPELLVQVLALHPPPPGPSAGKEEGQKHWRAVLRDLCVSAMRREVGVPDWRWMTYVDWEAPIHTLGPNLQVVKQAFIQECKALIIRHCRAQPN